MISSFRTHRFRLLVAAVILLQCLFAIYQFHLRQGFFLDEIYTYGLSNSNCLPFLTGYDPTVWQHWTSGADLLQYVTVQPGQAFQYGSVWYNQAQDVHPPLYYALVHTVSSFFPGQFSFWYAEVVNLAAYAVTLVALFLLARRFLQDRWSALAVLVLYGFGLAGIENAVYLRMYMVMAMWSVLSLYLHHRLLTAPRTRPGLLAALFCVTCLGALTQYYFILLSFFLAALTCLVLWRRRGLRAALPYALCMLLAIGAMLAIFPAVFTQLFGGGHMGSSTLENAGHLPDLKRPVLFVYYALKLYFGNHALLTIAGAGLLVLLTAAALVFRFRAGRHPRLPATDTGRANLVLGIATGLAFLAVSMLAVYVTTRYIYFLEPMLALLLVALLRWILGSFIAHPRSVQRILLAAAAVECLCSCLFCRTSLLYYNIIETMRQQTAPYSGLYGIVVTGEDNNDLVTQNLLEMAQTKELYCTDGSVCDELPGILDGRDVSDGLLVWLDLRPEVYTADEADALAEQLQDAGHFSDYTLLYESNNTRAYLYR